MNSKNTSSLKNINRCTHKTLFLTPTSKEEVVSVTTNVKSSASSGFDEFSSNLLRSIRHEMATPLTFWIDLSFEESKFPDFLRESKVIGIYF